jgi:hypothetical protein
LSSAGHWRDATPPNDPNVKRLEGVLRSASSAVFSLADLLKIFEAEF